MNRQQEQLFERIQAFEIDEPGIARSFADRLASENRWPVEFARRVVDEYKKFVFLAVAAGHQVSPAKAVDHAWHLHLTYTRSYWDRLCGQTLRRPLHHDPSRGGADEDRKYQQLYARTVASYERMFGNAPPRDIWPAPAVAEIALDGAKSNIWSVPDFTKPRKPRNVLRVAAVAALLAGVAIVVLACTTSIVSGQSSAGSAAWVVIGIVACVVVFVIAVLRSSPNKEGVQRSQAGGDGGASHASMYGVAMTPSGKDHKDNQLEMSTEADSSTHAGSADSGSSDGAGADGGAGCGSAGCGSSCGGGGCGGG